MFSVHLFIVLLKLNIQELITHLLHRWMKPWTTSTQLSNPILTTIRQVNLPAKTLKLISLKYNEASFCILSPGINLDTNTVGSLASCMLLEGEVLWRSVCGIMSFRVELREIGVLHPLWTWPLALRGHIRPAPDWIPVPSISKSQLLQWLTGGDVASVSPLKK